MNLYKFRSFFFLHFKSMGILAYDQLINRFILKKNSTSYDQFIIQYQIVDIKLMAGPLCLTQLVFVGVGFFSTISFFWLPSTLSDAQLGDF